MYLVGSGDSNCDQCDFRNGMDSLVTFFCAEKRLVESAHSFDSYSSAQMHDEILD